MSARQPGALEPGARNAVHVVAAVIVAGSLALAYLAPERYEPLMEEDRAVEWGTFAFFLAAAIVRGAHALRARRPFDGLIALFCLFVAGEEISWGQRLIGYTPPAAFLEHNTQQEANLHNFSDVFGRPKWMLIAALAGYGVLLPAVARVAQARRLLDRVGATPPPLAIAGWLVVAIAMLVWYPVIFTGEWAELLSGWLFLAAAPIAPRPLAWLAAAAVPVSLAMTGVSATRRSGLGDHALCARGEVAALVDDLVAGDAATPDLDAMGSLHKRVWGAVTSGFVDADRLRRFRAASCPGDRPGPVATRRRYAVDPWGTAYWMEVTRADDTGEQRVVVYSFGPNRRRDGEPGETTGDDIAAVAVRR